MAPALVLVNGFLGSGKTTLLIEAARRVIGAGGRAAVLTNDQGAGLVDTELARAAGLATAEIAGGCFCCRFSDFLAAADRLAAVARPDVIFAEPVGSCTDLVATVLGPLEELYGGRFHLAPLTVLVEPRRAEELLLAPGADPRLAYLFRKQIDEADILCYSKCDLAPAPLPPIFEGAAPLRLSAYSGEGVAAWLAGVLEPGAAPVRKLLEIDYARYGEAEAALGWLNWTGKLRTRSALTPSAVVGPLLDELIEALTQAGIAIAHLKVLDRSGGGGVLKAGVCRNTEAPSIDGDLLASPSRRHHLMVNLRAAGAPRELRLLVEQAVAHLPGAAGDIDCQAFRPAPPQPEHRVTRARGAPS